MKNNIQEQADKLKINTSMVLVLRYDKTTNSQWPLFMYKAKHDNNIPTWHDPFARISTNHIPESHHSGPVSSVVQIYIT